MLVTDSLRVHLISLFSVLCPNKARLRLLAQGPKRFSDSDTVWVLTRGVINC